MEIISILEPFADKSQINSYRIQLHMDNSHSNPNNKILLFWTYNVIYKDQQVHEQQIACVINHVECAETFLITFEYA